MVNFIIPLNNGKINSSKSKKNLLVIDGDFYDKILSPADGIVSKIDKKECDGLILIEHGIGMKKIYSKICGCGRIDVGEGNPVSKGEKIGTAATNQIELILLDSFGDKLPYSDYINKVDSDDGLIDDKKNDSDKNKKGLGQPEKEKEKETEKNKEEDNTKTSTSREYNPEKKIPNPFLDLLLLPFHVVDGAMSNKNKKLKEEIDRIKELIK